MSFHFKCPHCNAKLEAEDDWQGLETSCPQCSQNIKIVKTSPVPPPLPSTPPPLPSTSSQIKPIFEQSDSTFDDDSLLGKINNIKQIILPNTPKPHSTHTASSSGKCTCGKCHKEIDGNVEICPHCGIAREWYRMGFEEEIRGPFSEYDFKEEIKNGAMNATDYVWRWGQNGWIQLGDSELKDSLWADIPPTIQKRPEVDLEILLKMLTLLEVILATVVFFLCLHFKAGSSDAITGLYVISHMFGIFWFISIWADGCILRNRKYDVGFSFLYWTPYYLLRRAKVLQYTPTLTPGYFGIYLFMPFVWTIAYQLIYNTIR